MKCAEVVLPSLILIDGVRRSSITEGDTIEMNWELAPFSCLGGHVTRGKTWRPAFEGSGWLRACVPLSPFSARLRRDQCGGWTSYSVLTISYCLTVYCAEGRHLAVLRRSRCFLCSASFPAACRSLSHLLWPVTFLATRWSPSGYLLCDPLRCRWRQSICGFRDGAMISYFDYMSRTSLLPLGQQGSHHMHAGSDDDKVISRTFD